MFVSRPQYLFPMPSEMEEPGAKHWRIVELTLHAPWFLLSVDIGDSEQSGSRVTRTLCIAWDNDLVDFAHSIDADRISGIVFMAPPWASPNSQWCSREVREVWKCSSTAGQSVLLVDAAGQEFDCGLRLEHIEPMQKELVLSVTFARRQRRPHGQVKTPPSSRRDCRQASARKPGR